MYLAHQFVFVKVPNASIALRSASHGTTSLVPFCERYAFPCSIRFALVLPQPPRPRSRRNLWFLPRPPRLPPSLDSPSHPAGAGRRRAAAALEGGATSCTNTRRRKEASNGEHRSAAALEGGERELAPTGGG